MTTQRRTIARIRAMTRNVRTSTTVGIWVCTVSAIGLLVASFIVPPMGEISPSVLKAGSLIFAFAALIEVREAIAEGLGVKLTHGQTVVEVRDTDGTPSPDAGGNDNEEDADDTPTP